MKITLYKFIAGSIHEFQTAAGSKLKTEQGRQELIENVQLLSVRMFYQTPALEELKNWIDAIEQSVVDLENSDEPVLGSSKNSYRDKIEAISTMLRGRYEHLQGYTVDKVLLVPGHANIIRFVGNVRPATLEKCLAVIDGRRSRMICALNNLADAGLVDMTGAEGNPTISLTGKGEGVYRVL